MASPKRRGVRKPAGFRTKRTAFDQSAYLHDRGETPAVDETKIIAAILCGQTIVGEDPPIDLVRKIVDLYERILAELLARRHGSPSRSTLPQ